MTADAGTWAPPARRVDLRRWKPRKVSPLAIVAVACIGLMLFLALFGPMLVDNPETISSDSLEGPSGDHWFGTDALGRDYFARVVHGARLSMGLAVGAIAISTALALVIGMLSGYLKGPVDLFLQRIIDTLLAFPGLILIMFFASVFGPSFRSLLFSLGLVLAPGVSRVVRSSTLAVASEPYVEAARVMGASAPRILMRHILPNIVAPLLVYSSAGLGVVILAEGGLSFLGLGIAPPTPSWGKMLSESRTYLREPWLSVFPGVAITIAVLGFNLLGDTLRDRLDPRLRSL